MDTQTDGEITPTSDVFVRFFEDNKHWSDNPEYNRLFIQTQFNWLNDLLQARGYVFINDVYDALGVEKTQYGQLHGWKKGPIEFGITHQVGSGRIWIRLNHEGNILDALPEF